MYKINLSKNINYIFSLQIVDPSLPKSCKTLTGTPRKNNIIDLDNGKFLYFGLKKIIQNFESTNVISENVLSIDIGIDGVGITNSSTSSLWPILINVVGYDEILLVGCFCGQSKPLNVNDFLKSFCDEMFDSLQSGININNVHYNFLIRAIVCDAPARSFVLDTISHTGYNSCTKCTIPGKYILNRVTFPGVGYESRTNESFRNKSDEKYHNKLEKPIIESLPIDIVKCTVIDIMHSAYLVITKQYLSLQVLDRKKEYNILKNFQNHLYY